jgi:predicted DNA-binding transcriptional regulator AlpA
MSKISFEELPQAVSRLDERLQNIEKLLQAQSGESKQSENDLLNIQQAGEMLNLSVPTLYGYVHDMLIPYSKIKKRLYFSKRELMEWVQSGRKKTISEINSSAHESIVKRK